MGAALGMNEGGVAGAVRSLDLDIGFDDFEAGGGSGDGGGEARGYREADEIAAGQGIVRGLRLLFV